MIIDGIQVEKFNNQEYVLLCTYMYKGEKIYCFSRINDQVFCTKENENYIPVTDKFKINLYKNLFGFARRTRRDIVAAKGGLRRDLKISIDALKKEVKDLNNEIIKIEERLEKLEDYKGE